jgi:hypothetical protein
MTNSGVAITWAQPPLGRLHSMAGPAVYTLNCFVPGGSDTFPVNIAKGASVGDLKKAIKEEIPTVFANIPIYELQLFKLEIPDKELANEVKEHLKTNPSALRATQKLSEVFLQLPKSNMLHIVVKAPESEPSLFASVYPIVNVADPLTNFIILLTSAAIFATSMSDAIRIHLHNVTLTNNC